MAQRGSRSVAGLPALSIDSMRCLVAAPPAAEKPPVLPLAATTRWQGTMIGTGLSPSARPHRAGRALVADPLGHFAVGQRQALHHRLGGIEHVHEAPRRSRPGSEGRLVPKYSLGRQVRQMSGMVDQRHSIPRCADHQDATVRLDQLGERRPFSIAVILGMIKR